MSEDAQVEDIVKCPECNSRNLERDETRGELVCQDCGLVLEDNVIDQGAEWRVFSPEQGDQRARTGAPMTVMLHDKGLSTDIDWQNKDYSGKTINSRYRSQFYRMRKWQKRSRVSNATERNLAMALAELDRMASRLELPKSVREAAAVNYKKAVEKRLIRGRSIEGVAAASLYAACRQCGVPRTLDEIGQASRTGRKEIGRTYRFMVRELKMKIMPTGPEDYISRFCSGLGLDAEVEAKAYELIKAAQEKELTSGRGPTGIAASIIYIASVLCGKRRTQREVAEVAGVTEVTIRNRYKELIQNLNIELDI
ncbi:MAG: transcription initiation factor IIB [Candidatus Thermoplasmatota archaeon]|nr:transcription initiation factor IIB [Candidatus Thalassarchaeaceae archaeon]MEE3083553.1 transcription initiation factor IIB [Candidatus Thermoplasmatota archaeon]